MASDPMRRRYDVLVVGGGPAGAVTAWALARRGLRVAVFERAQFPREKVCGDFVEPRGLRLLEAMGCLRILEAASPLPITHVAMFLQARCAYRGRIPFYGETPGLPPHGYIIPRRELDAVLLDAARRAGASVYDACTVKSVARDGRDMRVTVGRGTDHAHVRGHVVVGADGTHSIVAQGAGLRHDDRRYMAVSQRAYVEGVAVRQGEAAFFFDRDLFPGYGWMFPMSGERANIGVGILAETQTRYGISVPQLFRSFVEKLRLAHPGCAGIRVAGKPLGGIVKTYGGSGPNCFDGGVLVGDAGCFVDPVTGEGIAPAAESALIAAPVVAAAVEQGRSDLPFLSRYERDFRAYFDPAMRYLDLCAAVMRNRFMRDFWLTAVARGCRMAAEDPAFARVAGAGFGGMDVRPLSILSRMWSTLVGDLGAAAAGMLGAAGGVPLSQAVQPGAHWARAVVAWSDGWWQSLVDDPWWHTAWAADTLYKWTQVMGALDADRDPRAQGPLASLASGGRSASP